MVKPQTAEVVPRDAAKVPAATTSNRLAKYLRGALKNIEELKKEVEAQLCENLLGGSLPTNRIGGLVHPTPLKKLGCG